MLEVADHGCGSDGAVVDGEWYSVSPSAYDETRFQLRLICEHGTIKSDLFSGYLAAIDAAREWQQQLQPPELNRLRTEHRTTLRQPFERLVVSVRPSDEDAETAYRSRLTPAGCGSSESKKNYRRAYAF